MLGNPNAAVVTVGVKKSHQNPPRFKDGTRLWSQKDICQFHVDIGTKLETLERLCAARARSSKLRGKVDQLELLGQHGSKTLPHLFRRSRILFPRSKYVPERTHDGVELPSTRIGLLIRPFRSPFNQLCLSLRLPSQKPRDPLRPPPPPRLRLRRLLARFPSVSLKLWGQGVGVWTVITKVRWRCIYYCHGRTSSLLGRDQRGQESSMRTLFSNSSQSSVLFTSSDASLQVTHRYFPAPLLGPLLAAVLHRMRRAHNHPPL